MLRTNSSSSSDFQCSSKETTVNQIAPYYIFLTFEVNFYCSQVFKTPSPSSPSPTIGPILEMFVGVEENIIKLRVSLTI